METSNERMKLEIGSGNRPRPGFKHLDINPDSPELDYCGSMDCIPCEDGIFDEVWGVHVIEHVPIPQARATMRECLRVLKPGGFLLLDTPNWQRTCRLYLHGGWEEDFKTLTPGEQELCSLNGTPNKMLWACFKAFSSANQWDVHFANYDPELLTALCLEAGFARVEVIQENPSLAVRAYKGT